MSEGRVVVLVKPDVLRSDVADTFAAQINALGLTAYGKTHDEAIRKVKRMVAATVQAHREAFELAAWLNKTGVEWHWESEYKGSVPVEDARVSGRLQHSDISLSTTEINSWRNTSEPLPMVA